MALALNNEGSVMEVDGSAYVPEAERVTEQEARMELDRLLSDPQFHLTERHRNFLKYVAQEMFEGRAAKVKAYTIAVDVFGRPCDFDPINDPIVRIEATRLRAALCQYYESRTEEGSVRIELPRGNYIPSFTKARLQPEGRAEWAAPHDMTLEEVVRKHQNMITRGRLIVSAIVAALALGSIWLFTPRGPVLSEKPFVAIEMKLAGGGTDAEANLIRDYLMIALSQFHTLKLAAGEKIKVSETPLMAEISLFWPMARTTRTYQVTLKYHPSETDRSVWWQIVDPGTGEALYSGVELVSLDKISDIEVRRELITHLAIRLAGTRGVINTLELAREVATPTLGNGCLVRSAAALERRAADDLREVRNCLEATLQAVPNDPAANAELAILLLEPEGAEAKPSGRALALAAKAVALDPMSDRANYAQMLTQFRSGLTEAAVASGHRAIALNPYNRQIQPHLEAFLEALLVDQGRKRPPK